MLFDLTQSQTGDILLVSNKAFLSRIQKLGQSMATLKYAKYSHAILVVIPGIFIEATKNEKRDIDFFCIDDLRKRFDSEYLSNYKIIRYKKINPELSDNIVESAKFFYGQNYNSNILYKKLYRSHANDKSYCSELISRIYEKSHIVIPRSKHQDIWPVHLDHLTKTHTNTWEDITHIYKKEFRPQNLLIEKCYLFKRSIELNFRGAQHLKRYENLFKEPNITTDTLHENPNLNDFFGLDDLRLHIEKVTDKPITKKIEKVKAEDLFSILKE